METETETETETDRQTDRQAETDRQRQRATHTTDSEVLAWLKAVWSACALLHAERHSFLIFWTSSDKLVLLISIH